MLEDVLAASLGVGDAQQSAIPPCHLSNVRFLEHTIRGASIAANLSNVRFLEHTIGGASIAAKLSNVRFLEHTIGGASIAAKLSNVRFLEHTSLLLDVWFAAADFQRVCKCAGFQQTNTGQDMFLRRWPRSSGGAASRPAQGCRSCAAKQVLGILLMTVC